MPVNPYSGGGGYFDQEQFNALHGAYSPEAILAAANNGRPTTGSNAFEQVLKHSLDFARPQPLAAPQTAPPSVGMSVGASEFNRDTGGDYGGGGVGTGGGVGAGAVTPATTDTTARSRGVGPSPGTSPTNPKTGAPYNRLNPGTVDPELWNTADQYVREAAKAGQDYSFLYEHPDAITEFRNWAIANKVSNDPNAKGDYMDFVDWLALRYPDMPHGLAGRAGYNTAAAWLAKHQGGGGGGMIESTTPTSNAQAAYDATRAFGGTPVTPGAPSAQGANALSPGAASGVPVNQWRASHGLPPLGTAAPGTTAPPTMPTAPPSPAGPTSVAPGANPYLDSLMKALQTSQDLQLQNSLRQYRSAAGAVGLENTGAYLPGQQDLVASLASQFGQQRAEAMMAASEAERGRQFQGQQSELDRTLQKYGIDVNSYITKYKTDTEAGVQLAAQQMQYDLGLKGIQIDQEKLKEVIRNNTLQYNLGVGNQDLQRYGIDQGNAISLMQLLQQLGPEALFGMLFGPQAAPGVVPYAH
jgi:hypothetical protein